MFDNLRWASRVARYRDRAVEIRESASLLKDADAREELCSVATEYELLAEHLERVLEPLEPTAQGETAGYWAR
jgi:hypothetical protein